MMALFRLGQQNPVETRRFVDFPDAKLKTVNDIEWGPNIFIKVKGVCWYVRDGNAVIPLLQPRKKPLPESGMAFYASLGRQAFCKGDWREAVIDLIDLSGDDDEVVAQPIYQSDLSKLDDRMIAQYVTTFMAAKERADALRASKTKNPPKSKQRGLFDPPEPNSPE
ncbi:MULTISPECIES: hypothetical protein [unclassified Sphingobium]|uniref:hypothetical protein n=1 Tax=unclassified Sphingobium TaxID=2611147 RepID=UPI0022252ED3|nr:MULTISPECIES: hypothetical protein [unclassified Sphingobium]